MINNITSLYPQYQYNGDRRQNNIPVAVDRRSGTDRRTQDRVVLDTKLTKDIFEVKGQVSKLEKLSPSFLGRQLSMQSFKFAEKNNFTQDQFIKSTKPDTTEILRQEAKLRQQSDTAFKMSVLAAALSGIAAASFMGPIGAVIAVGSTFYIGSKICKNVIEQEMKDDEEIKEN